MAANPRRKTGTYFNKFLERVQKGDQIVFLLIAQVHLEAQVVKVDQLLQVCGGSIVKVGCASSQSAENWPLTAAYVNTLTGH
jgi:hypothetical protein